jgi:hypothetical protein
MAAPERRSPQQRRLSIVRLVEATVRAQSRVGQRGAESGVTFVKKFTAVGEEVYATVMLVAVLIDIALTVLLFSRSVGWGIAYLVVGTGIFFIVAHRLAMLAVGPHLLPETGYVAKASTRSAAVPATATAAPRADPCPVPQVAEPHFTEEGYPWGAGWWENADMKHEDGAVTTGSNGIAFLCERDDSEVLRQWEYAWDRVKSAVASRIEDMPALARHPGLARDIRDYAITISCDHPLVGLSESHRLVILASRAHPLGAWKTLLSDHGVRLVDPTTESDTGTPDHDPAMPEDPRPATWAIPSAGLREHEHAVAPGWWQSPDGVWNPPGDGSPPIT